MKLGIAIPRSGMLPFMGKAFINGVKLALTQQGAIDQVTFSIEDLQKGSNNEVLIEKTTKLLVHEDVDVLFCMAGTKTFCDAVATLEAYEKPILLTNLGANVPAHIPEDLTFTSINSLGMWHGSYLLGLHAGENVGKKVANTSFMYDAGYEFDLAYRMGLMEAGGEVWFNSVTPHGMPLNYDQVMGSVIGSESDHIFAMFSFEEAKSFLKGLSQAEQHLPVLGLPSLVSDEVLASLDNVPENVFVSTSWDTCLNTEKNRQFIESYEEMFGRKADEFAMLGYESGLWLAQVINAADFPLSNGKKFNDLMRSITIDGPRGPLSFEGSRKQTVATQYLLKVTDDENGAVIRTVEKELGKISEEQQAKTIAEMNPDQMSGWLQPYLCT